MLYKPTTISPHRETVNPNDLTFSCQTMSNSKISRAQLVIDDGVCEYYYNNPDYFDITTDISSAKINFRYDNSLSYGYNINNKGNRGGLGDSARLSVGKQYKWRMRFYENSDIFSSWIGWGAISSSYSSVYKNGDDYYFENKNGTRNHMLLLKIRPHTNMPFKNCTGNSPYYPKLWSGYDEQAQYQIKIDGQYYPIVDYKFYSPIQLSSPYDTNSFDKDKDLDRYGTPLWGYAIVAYDGNLANKIENSELEYNIFANYIDTDTYYFETNSPPQLDLYEYFENNGSPQRRIINSDNLKINYSNLCIVGEYTQAEGNSINSYSMLLEEFSDNSYHTIDSLHDVYSPYIEYKFNRFLNNHQYKLTVSVTDNAGATIERTIDIKSEYQEDIYPIDIKSEEYPEHNSLIVDFSELKSISGKELIESNHQFLACNEETGVIDRFLEYTNNACHVEEGNIITYDEVDGESPLSFSKESYLLQCKVDDFKERIIFESVNNDDNTLIRLRTEAPATFIVEYTNSNSNSLHECRFSPYFSWFNTYRTTQSRIDAVSLSMKKQRLNYETPPLYYEDLPYNETDYYYEETALSGQVWSVIMEPEREKVYFKNMSVKDSNWDTSNQHFVIQGGDNL